MRTIDAPPSGTPPASCRLPPWLRFLKSISHRVLTSHTRHTNPRPLQSYIFYLLEKNTP